MQNIRMTIYVPRELKRKIETEIPWGIRSELFRKMISKMVEEIERDGFLAATQKYWSE